MMGMHRRLDPKELDRPAPGRSAATYVYVARALRDFGDGFIAVLLPVYLTAIGMGPFEVGVVSTLALLGSASMTLGIGLLGARVDRRMLLMADDRHRARVRGLQHLCRCPAGGVPGYDQPIV